MHAYMPVVPCPLDSAVTLPHPGYLEGRGGGKEGRRK